MNQAVKRVKEYSGVLSAGLAVVMTTQVEGSGGRITSWLLSSSVIGKWNCATWAMDAWGRYSWKERQLEAPFPHPSLAWQDCSAVPSWLVGKWGSVSLRNVTEEICVWGPISLFSMSLRQYFMSAVGCISLVNRCHWLCFAVGFWNSGEITLVPCLLYGCSNKLYWQKLKRNLIYSKRNGLILEEMVCQRGDDGCDISRSLQWSSVVCCIFHNTPPKLPTYSISGYPPAMHNFPTKTWELFSQFVSWQYVNTLHPEFRLQAFDFREICNVS